MCCSVRTKARPSTCQTVLLVRFKPIHCIYAQRITNSFIVPFEEDEKDPSVWFLDHNYIEAMNAMFKKVNGKQGREDSDRLEHVQAVL